MKLGLQLFTLINYMKKPGGLKEVLGYAADAGYDGVEFAGFYGLPVSEIRAELDRLGLEAAGIHLGWDNMSFQNLESNPADVIGTAKKLGAKSVTVASYPGKDLADWENFGAKINEFGKLFRENGMRFGYHNHRIELKKLGNDYIIDIIMSKCAPENVFWELDPRHVVVAGEDPVKFAAKYKDRSPFIHMRDIAKLTGPDTADDSAVGDGIVDIPGVVRASGHHDWLIVEENSCPEILDHIKRSAKFLRENCIG